MLHAFAHDGLASTVAVVVPSPALSLVLSDLFDHLRTHVLQLVFQSISLATDTPSLVTVGRRTSAQAPRCGPLGPRVTDCVVDVHAFNHAGAGVTAENYVFAAMFGS